MSDKTRFAEEKKSFVDCLYLMDIIVISSRQFTTWHRF